MALKATMHKRLFLLLQQSGCETFYYYILEINYLITKNSRRETQSIMKLSLVLAYREYSVSPPYRL